MPMKQAIDARVATMRMVVMSMGYLLCLLERTAHDLQVGDERDDFLFGRDVAAGGGFGRDLDRDSAEARLKLSGQETAAFWLDN